MPIPSPGTYDQASQATLLLVKAKTDLIPAGFDPATQATLLLVKAQVDAIGIQRTSIIEPDINVPAPWVTATIYNTTLTPPAGETWEIDVFFGVYATTGMITLGLYNGEGYVPANNVQASLSFTTNPDITQMQNGIHLHVIVTAAKHLWGKGYHSDGANRQSIIGYSGFKVA